MTSTIFAIQNSKELREVCKGHKVNVQMKVESMYEYFPVSLKKAVSVFENADKHGIPVEINLRGTSAFLKLRPN